MRRPWSSPAMRLVGMLLAAPVGATPGPLVGWGGAGETGMRWDASEGRSTARPLVRESNLRGWVGVTVAGQLVDSRWLGWSWNVRPGFVRSGGNQPGASLETSELAHQLTVTSQPWPWLRAQGSADRDRIVANRGEDASRESRFSHAEARADVRVPVVALGALARRERSNDRWMSTALAPELEWHIDRRAFETWLESSKMRLTERRTLEAVPGAGADVRTRHTTFDHALRWGRGSRLATQLEWSGQSPRAITIVERAIQEQLHVRHTNWLASDYRFQDTHARLGVGEGTNRSHFAELAARTDGRGLAVNGGLRTDQSPGRDGHAWSVGPRAFWQQGWRDGMRLSGEAGASLEHERRTGASDARLAVANETHTVTATRSFTLAVAGVDSATVVVRDASGVSGYFAGLDWSLVRSGSETILLIPLGSRIAVGDLVRVTYEATPPGTPSRRSTRANLALGAQWRGVSARLEGWQIVARDTPRDRGAASLGQREQSATIAAVVPRGAARFELSASGRRRVVEGRVARAENVNAGVTWRFSPAWLATADAAVSNARESGGRLGSSSQRMSMVWNGGGAWHGGVHLDRSQFDRTGAPVVTQRMAGADAAARWGLLEASLRVDLGERKGDPGHHFRRFSLALLRRLR